MANPLPFYTAAVEEYDRVRIAQGEAFSLPLAVESTRTFKRAGKDELHIVGWYDEHSPLHTIIVVDDVRVIKRLQQAYAHSRIDRIEAYWREEFNPFDPRETGPVIAFTKLEPRRTIDQMIDDLDLFSKR